MPNCLHKIRKDWYDALLPKRQHNPASIHHMLFMNRLAAATALIIVTACTEHTTPLAPENTEKGGYEAPEIEFAQRIQKEQLPVHFAVLRCIQRAQDQDLSDQEELIDPETGETIPQCDTKKDEITWL